MPTDESAKESTKDISPERRAAIEKKLREGMTNYDEVLQAALFLSDDDLEKLIGRLIAERDGTHSGFLPRDGFKRPFGRELVLRS